MNNELFKLPHRSWMLKKQTDVENRSKCGQSEELGSVPTRNVYIFIKSEAPAKEVPSGTNNQESF